MQQLNVHFERIEKTYCHVCCCWRLKENLEVLFSIDQSVHKLGSLKAAGQMGNGRSTSHKSAYRLQFLLPLLSTYTNWYCISHVLCLQFNSLSLLSLSLSLSVSLYTLILSHVLSLPLPLLLDATFEFLADSVFFWVFITGSLSLLAKTPNLFSSSLWCL